MSHELIDPPPVAPASRPDTADAATAPIVRVRGACRTWRLGRTAVQALDGVDIDVHAGELLAICGPSGSGKTTLLNLIGLIDRPTAGEVRLHGRAVQALPAAELARLRSRHLGFVFQNFNLVPVLTALENVLLPLQIRGPVGPAERERARGLLGEVGLAQQMQQRPDRMSGGQRQRVALARALATEPQIVVADEPTANLDSESTAGVMALVRRLNRSTGTTFVFSTHDPRVVDHVHRSVALRDGRLQPVGSAA